MKQTKEWLSMVSRACLILVSLIGAMVLMGCPLAMGDTPVEQESSQPGGEAPIPEGYARVTAKLPDMLSNRTALPDEMRFTEFRVIMTPPTDASWRPVNKRYIAGETIQEDIGPGAWTYAIYAFGGDTEHAIAQGTGSFTIKAGETKVIPVPLSWNAPSALIGNGTANLRLEFPGELKFTDVTKALYAITKVDGTPVANGSLVEGNNSKLLPAGIYLAKVQVEDMWERAGYFSEVLYIYPETNTIFTINATNETQIGEYGAPIMIISVNPLVSPILIAPVMEAERPVIVRYTLTGTDSISSVRWYKNGTLQAQANDSTSFDLETHKMSPGMSEIMIVVTDENGLVSSTSTRLNILPEKKAEHLVYSESEMKAALAAIAANNSTAGTIRVGTDFALNPLEIGEGLAGKTLTINGQGKTLTLASQGTINVNGAFELIIDNLRIRGIGPTNDWETFQAHDGGWGGNTSPLLTIVNGGIVTLQNNATLTDNSSSILQEYGGLTFTVGGVFVGEEAKLIIEDSAKIINMSADFHSPYEIYTGERRAAGAVYVKGGKLTVRGTIQDCRAGIEGDPSLVASAIYIDGGSVEISNNASITQNQSWSNNFVSKAGTVYITDNGHLSMSGNATITENYIYIADLYNWASGGVYIQQGEFQLLGGTIGNNKLDYALRFPSFGFVHIGAGVYGENGARFIKTAGTISGNTINSINSSFGYPEQGLVNTDTVLIEGGARW
jgi:hypothetical protein